MLPNISEKNPTFPQSPFNSATSILDKQSTGGKKALLSMAGYTPMHISGIMIYANIL